MMTHCLSPHAGWLCSTLNCVFEYGTEIIMISTALLDRLETIFCVCCLYWTDKSACESNTAVLFRLASDCSLWGFLTTNLRCSFQVQWNSVCLWCLVYLNSYWASIPTQWNPWLETQTRGNPALKYRLQNSQHSAMTEFHIWQCKIKWPPMMPHVLPL